MSLETFQFELQTFITILHAIERQKSEQNKIIFY